MSKTNSDLIKDLRTLTQAPMKDCKDALTEANWDLDKAVDIVKAKGLQNTSRSEGKVAAEGTVKVCEIVAEGLGSCMVMLEVNCQTDFVAKSVEFLSFADDVINGLCNLALSRGSQFSLDTMPSTVLGTGKSLEDHRKELMAKTKENIVVRRWWVQETVGAHRAVHHYTHSNNKLGVLVWMEAKNADAIKSPEFKELADNVAMQIAAMSPLAVERSRLTQVEIDRQKAIFETQLKELNKPAAQAEKILAGKLNKWFAEVCLVDQESVTTPKETVGSLLDKAGVRILGFTRCQVGEGIEQKPAENYADEVNKLAGLI